MSDAKASNGAQDPTPSVASDIVVPQPRINRRQVLKGGAAAAAVTAAGLFGPGPLPLLRRSAAAQGGPLSVTTDPDLWMVQVAISTFQQQYSSSQR